MIRDKIPDQNTKNNHANVIKLNEDRTKYNANIQINQDQQKSLDAFDIMVNFLQFCLVTFTTVLRSDVTMYVLHSCITMKCITMNANKVCY